MATSAAAVTGRIASPAAPLLAPLTRRRPAPADTEVLAHLLDLLAVALVAGLPTPDALAAVADAVEHSDPDAAEPLRAAAARMRLGATSAEAWRDVPGVARLAPVAPVLVRAGDGGGSVRSALEHAASRMRSEADAAATARAERASVLVAGPLGLCFLPAFVCLGVLPVVVGLADGMLPGVLP
ncbi:MAG: type II secretion system F family protein [Streptomyces sp.]|nr:type II secretion system F family protein [Streptomyces sp.]